MFTRLATAVFVLVLLAPPGAKAWTWPAKGEVLRPFDYGGGEYTSSGHRGIDVGGAVDSAVLVPAAGRVSFAGSLPSNGKTISIRTADGWAVTLTHLGSIVVSVGDGVAEGEPVGTIGPSGDAETREPHVQLGIGGADDPRGYVDPLTLLPPRESTPAPAASPAPAPEPVVQPASPEVAVPAVEAPVALKAPPRAAPTGAAPERPRATRSAAAPVRDTARSPRALSVRPTRARKPKASSSRHRPRHARPHRPARPASAVERPRFERESTTSEPAAPPVLSKSPGPVVSAVVRPAAAQLPVESDSRPPWALLAASLLALAGLALLRRCRVRRAVPGAERAAPIMDADELLPDHTHLLRQRHAAHRARVHHDRGGHPRAPSSAARRGDVLPHRGRRARGQGGAGGCGAGSRAARIRRPDRRRVEGVAGARQRVDRLLHSNHR